MSFGISVKLPLSFSSEGGYAAIKTIPEMVKQNLKNLLLTIPGERIMDNDFGVGLSTFLFEPNVDDVRNRLGDRIREQAEKYLSFIEITDLDITGQENEIYVSIYYNILPLSISDRISFIRDEAGRVILA